MSLLIHTTDSLDGRFSKSRAIAAHNGALRPKFASPFSAVAFSSGTWLQYSSWVSDAVGNDLTHSRIWQERVRKRAPPSLPPSCRRRRARNSFSAAPVRSRHLPHIRTGSGKHGESLRRDSEHVRGIYSRGGRSRMSPCSSPSEFPDPLPFPEFCRFWRDMRPPPPPPPPLSLIADLFVDFYFPASVPSIELRWETSLNPLPSPRRSINGYLNAPTYRNTASSSGRPKLLAPYRNTTVEPINILPLIPRFCPLCWMNYPLPHVYQRQLLSI